MDTKTDLNKEGLDIVKDTKEYLLFLKETGVSEVFTGDENNLPHNPPISPFRKGGLRGIETKSKRLADLREKIGECKRCKLWNGRTHIVFGTGNPDTKLLFVGEGPGEEEDRQGKPFVGRAGELLT